MFTALTSAVSGFGIGTWIKIGAAVVVALVIGGLYWAYSAEAALVHTRDVTIGVQTKQIADDQVNLKAYDDANKKWATAFENLRQNAVLQGDALKNANTLKEQFDAQLRNLEAELRANQPGLAARLNGLNDRLVCLLNAVSAGHADGCTVAPAGKAGAPASGAARP